MKYNPTNGAIVWSKKYDTGKDEVAYGCATDKSGNIYIAGVTNYGGNNDFLILKYAANGDTVWTRRYDGAAHGDDQALRCAVDNSGNLYAAGYSYTGGHYTLLLIKYNTNGDTVWTRRSSDVLDTLINPSAGCAADSAGNVYITGMCGVQKGYGNRYSVTIKYNSSGTVLWTNHYDSPSIYDQTIACAVDSKNDLYVAGTSYNGNNDDWLIIKINSLTGDTLWTIKRNGTLNGGDYATGCALDVSGNLYVAGFTNFMDSDTTGDYLVIKYKSTVTAVRERNSDIPGEFTLYQNYPNPFNPSTMISYTLKEKGFVKLKVYGISGELVKILVNEQKDAGYYESEFDGKGLASGVYVYRLEVIGDGNRVVYSDMKKTVLLK